MTPSAPSVAATSPSSSTDAPAPIGAELADPEVGYSLRYPADWRPAGRIVATEFGESAACRSAQIVDSQPPPGAGPGAQIERSFVQVCAVPVADGSTLESFMRRTYGDLLADLFRSAEVGGLAAFRTVEQAGQTTFFVQTDGHRLEIVAGVNADPELRAERMDQVDSVLRSLTFDAPER